ncbi:MFS transporter [Pedomonas mirosovicensis]|uniref:MFS transporter n=1 Tax=Pedomonas mirosovicensis TaxID=2908641 RepID=UPI00216984A0|nr:MFS transporter [Pedomonas mirosovicensis]MCH8686175.1 MFS transporter [Pedomonas mirosovicensis]
MAIFGAFAPTGSRPVRWYNYAAYGSNDILGAGSMAVISGWVLFFYTTFCGLEAWQAGLIFTVARVLDAIASPVIGHISDNMGQTALGRRFGRRRFFILAAIPLLPSFAIMWVSGQSFWYYLATYVLFELVYAMEIIPYETLAAEMGKDYRTKAKFAGIRILFAQASAILAGYLPAMLIESLGKESADTFLYMGILFSALFVVTAALLFLFSWERPLAEVAALKSGEAKPSLGAAFGALYHNLFSTFRIRAFRLHLGMYLGGYISQDVFNAAFTFFVVFALAGSITVASTLLGTMYIVQFVAVMIAINLALKTSPAFAYRLAAASFAIGVITLLAMWGAGVRSGDLLLWVPIALAGLGRGALNYIPWATYNYMADVDEIVTGRRREGAFAGVMTFVRKLTQAVAVAGVGALMSLGGFQKDAAVQPPEAITTIALVLGIGTVGMLIFGVLVSLRFRLDPRTHAVLMEEIDRFKNTPNAPASAEARAIVEDLSGWPHEQLWGRNPVAKAGAARETSAQGGMAQA